MQSSDPKKDTTISLRLPRDVYEQLKQRAQRENRTASNYVLTLIMRDLGVLDVVPPPVALPPPDPFFAAGPARSVAEELARAAQAEKLKRLGAALEPPAEQKVAEDPHPYHTTNGKADP